MSTQKISKDERDALLSTLKERFEEHMYRHKGMKWASVEAKLKTKAKKMWSLHEMERTGGEPDVIAYDKKTDEYLFVDCSKESPKGRRSTCYDPAAQKSRKEHAPENSAVGMAIAMNARLLTEAEYRKLQKLEDFDTTTSSWVDTPDTIRRLGGALFCDRRFNTVFVYHNGAESYYASRGFRCSLRV